LFFFFFFVNHTAPTEIYTLSLHDALPISGRREKPPSLREVAQAAGRVPISRYSFETIELFKESVEKWQREINERRQTLDSSAPAAPGSSASKSPPDELRFYPIEVDFNALPDEAERRFFESVP